MKKLILIGGWAMPPDILRGLGQTFSHDFDLDILTFNQHLSSSEPNSHLLGLEKCYNYLKQNIDPVILMGWSLGGMLSIELANHLKDQCQALVLINATAKFCKANDTAHGFEEKYIKALKLGLRQDKKKALRGFYEIASFPHSIKRNELQNWIDAVESIPIKHLSQGLDYLLKTDLRLTVKKIYQPTLIIHGKQDAVVPIEAGRWLKENIPHATMISHETEGHGLPLREPRWILDKTKSHLEKCGL